MTESVTELGGDGDKAETESGGDVDGVAGGGRSNGGGGEVGGDAGGGRSAGGGGEVDSDGGGGGGRDVGVGGGGEVLLVPNPSSDLAQIPLQFFKK